MFFIILHLCLIHLDTGFLGKTRVITSLLNDTSGGNTELSATREMFLISVGILIHRHIKLNHCTSTHCKIWKSKTNSWITSWLKYTINFYTICNKCCTSWYDICKYEICF